MTRCDVNIGYVVTSSVKLHQEAPILFDLGGTGGVGELGGVSFIVGPGDTGDGRRNGLTGLTGVSIRRGVTGEFSVEFVSD